MADAIVTDAIVTEAETQVAGTEPLVRKWVQGDHEGTCALTNAAGLRAALEAGGAKLASDVTVVLKVGRFARARGARFRRLG